MLNVGFELSSFCVCVRARAVIWPLLPSFQNSFLILKEHTLLYNDFLCLNTFVVILKHRLQMNAFTIVLL